MYPFCQARIAFMICYESMLNKKKQIHDYPRDRIANNRSCFAPKTTTTLAYYFSMFGLHGEKRVYNLIPLALNNVMNR